MAKDKRDVLQVLESELVFIYQGGYNDLGTTPWRPKMIFEGSPTCPNFNDVTRSTPCSECVLMQFVPTRKRDERVRCRHIPLNDVGETVDTLYRWGTLEDAKLILGNWLTRTINKIRGKRLRFRPDRSHTGPGSHIPDGT